MNVMAKTEARASSHLRLRQKVAQVSDRFSRKAAELATRFEAFKEKGKPKITISQVRGLENVAYTTLKISDILDLVKKQIGRGRWPRELGEELLAMLNGLERDARQVAREVEGTNDDLPRQAHLLLCREYIKHLAAHFVYQRQVHGEEEESL